MSTAASMVSNALVLETKHKPKESEQNRNKGSQEGQMETTDATEDDAGEVDTEEIAEKKSEFLRYP